MAVACDDVQRLAHAHAEVIKVDGEDMLFHVVYLFIRAFRQKIVLRRWVHLLPHVEYGVHWKPAAARCRVNHVFVFFRVHHSDAHVDDNARSEVLAFLSLLLLIDKVLECVVDHFKIRIKDFDILQMINAHFEVGVIQAERGILFEYTLPFLFGVIEKFFYSPRDLRRRSNIAELEQTEIIVLYLGYVLKIPVGQQHIYFLRVICGLFLIIQFREDEHEYFLEAVHAVIRHDFIFEVKYYFLKRCPFQFVVYDEVFYREADLESSRKR